MASFFISYFSDHPLTCYYGEWRFSSLKLSPSSRSTPCFIVLHVTALHKYCIFYELKVRGDPVSGKSIGTI